jgi:hypothetical protein
MYGHRGLCLAAPGGFGSYGVKVLPAGVSFTYTKNADSLTESRWKDGINVFYVH